MSKLEEAAMTPLETPSPGDIEGLVALAQTYFDAAYEMNADKFSSIFHEASSVTRQDDDDVVVTPIAVWLEAVRGLTSPREAGGARDDRILSIAMTRDIAILKLRLRIPPREVTDLLSCLFLNGHWQVVQKVFAAEPLG